MSLPKAWRTAGLVLIVTAGCSSSADGVTPTLITSGDLAARVEILATDWYGPAETGGVTALISPSKSTIHLAALGEAEPDHPATADDLMRIGSITKTYTAAVVLRLAEQGLLSLDDPVSVHLSQLALPRDVTVRDLLGHTSGITDPEPADLIAEFRADSARRYTRDDLIAFANLPTNNDAREFRYANANYHLAGLVIEAATGTTYAEALRAEILQPGGLDHTYLVEFEPIPVPVVPGNVDLDGDGKEDSLAEIPYTAIDTYAWSAGAIATTPTDLVRFANALFDSTLLNDDSLRELTSGLGIIEIDQNWWGHNGGAPGYQAAFAHDPERHTTIAVFTNCPTCATTIDTWDLLTGLADEIDIEN